MKSTSYWLFYKVVWALLVVPALSTRLKEKEILPWLSSFFGWLHDHAISLVGEPGFPWVSGILLGVSIGILSYRTFMLWQTHKKESDFDHLDALTLDVVIHEISARH